jgi:shikimate dehydrogenase
MTYDARPSLTMPEARGTTMVYFCIADPVEQVKAPQAMNRVFAAAGIDAVMVPARVAPARLAGFVREAMALPNAGGMAASIPHKTALPEVVDRCDEASVLTGAVNAVRRGADGALEGALFDGQGFVAALAQHEVATGGKRVLLVGAGGAGLAIASALAALPLAAFEVFDVDPVRAATLVQRLRPAARCPLAAAASADPAGFDLVVQATPLGLRAGDPLPFDPNRVDAGATVVDILMTNAPTPLEAACGQRRIRVVPGHEMLVQQIPAYIEFFGFPALAAELRQPGDPVLRAVRAAITQGRPSA